MTTLKEHVKDADRRFEAIETKIDAIRDNHLAHLKSDLDGVKNDLEGVKTDVGWLKRYHWTVTIPAGIGAIAGLVNLIK